MTEWNADDLATIDRAGELRVAAQRSDGTLSTPRIVWHVVVNGSLYMRSVRGDAGGWYRGVRKTGAGTIDTGAVHAAATFISDDTHDEAIDRGYRDKYGSNPAVASITSPAARATTLRVEPR